MRPLLYSERDARIRRVGWARGGHHIAYYKNEHNLQCPLLQRDRTHYVLEWQMVGFYKTKYGNIIWVGVVTMGMGKGRVGFARDGHHIA